MLAGDGDGGLAVELAFAALRYSDVMSKIEQ